MPNAIRIFRHSVTMVFRDFGATLRATSAGLMVVVLAMLSFAFLAPDTFGILYAPSEEPPSLDDFPKFGGLVISALLFFVGMVMTVAAWHRFVLFSEDQRGDGFTPGAGVVLGYIGRSILLALAMLLLTIPLALPVGMVAALTGSPIATSLLLLPLNAIVGWVLLRFSLILPACAIGENLSFSESWNATKPLAGTIFGLMLLLAVISFAIELILTAALPPAVVGTLISLIISMIYALISASVLTTLYGITIQKREI